MCNRDHQQKLKMRGQSRFFFRFMISVFFFNIYITDSFNRERNGTQGLRTQDKIGFNILLKTKLGTQN